MLDPRFQAERGLMKARVSASWSVSQNHFLSKTNDRIFMKFHMNFWFFKDKKLIQSRKNVILRKSL